MVGGHSVFSEAGVFEGEEASDWPCFRALPVISDASDWPHWTHSARSLTAPGITAELTGKREETASTGPDGTESEMPSDFPEWDHR